MFHINHYLPTHPQSANYLKYRSMGQNFNPNAAVLVLPTVNDKKVKPMQKAQALTFTLS